MTDSVAAAAAAVKSISLSDTLGLLGRLFCRFLCGLLNGCFRAARGFLLRAGLRDFLAGHWFIGFGICRLLEKISEFITDGGRHDYSSITTEIAHWLQDALVSW